MFKIYRQPTTTDNTVHASSSHPLMQNLSSCNSYIKSVQRQDYSDELNCIKYITVDNTHSSTIAVEEPTLKYKGTYKRGGSICRQNLHIFLPQTLNNVFRKYDCKLFFKSNNDIMTILKPRAIKPFESHTGIYRIQCGDCNSFYGQTGRKCLPGIRNIFLRVA